MHFYIYNKDIKEIFYLHVFANGYFINEIEKTFFNSSNKKHNSQILKDYYLQFIKDNNLSSCEIEEVLKAIDKDIKDVFFNLHNRTHITEVFISNIYYGAIRAIFENDDYIKLLCLLEGHPDSGFASIIPMAEFNWFFSCLDKINDNQYIKPVSYFRDGEEPFTNLINQYKSGGIKSDLIIRNDNFSFDVDEIIEEGEELEYYSFLTQDFKINNQEKYKYFLENTYLDNNLSEEDKETAFLLKDTDSFILEHKLIELEKEYKYISKAFLDDIVLNGAEVFKLFKI